LYFLILLSLLSFGIEKAYAYDLKKVDKQYLFLDNDDIVRGFVWGLPSSIILQNEKGTYVQPEGEDTSEESVFFVDRILGVRSAIGYEFDESGLSRVRIFNEKFYKNPQDRINDLLTMQTYLTDRYGPPTEENFTWRNPREKNYPDNWGAAVYRGDLRIDILWENEESFTRLSLGNREIYKPEISLVFERPYRKASKETLILENKLKLP